MLLRRLYEDTLSQAAWMVACDETGQAIVVDPHRDIETYIRAAAADKLTITHVTETHIHADFVSGARALAEATGAQLALSGEGGRDWQYAFAAAAGARLLRDGDCIEVGSVRIDVMHTPGHTPEHLAFLVTDTTQASVPMGMLSGDFIFVGDVGRPDLLERAAGVGNTMETLARQLYRSLQKTRALPDHLQIWPGHGAGSACGKALGDVPSSTLGYERLVSWAFRASDEAAFVAEVLAGQPEPPAYFARMKTVNREGPSPRVDPGTVPHLAPDRFAKERAGGAAVIDVRSTADFAAGHLRGTLNIPTGNSFPNWIGSLIPPEQPIVLLIGSDASRLPRALRGATLVGMDHVIGWSGPEVMDASTTGDQSLEKTMQIGAADARASGRTILDVRGQTEWDDEHAVGARHAFLGRLSAISADIPRDTPIVLMCQGGSRSAIGASMLQTKGFTNVANLKGGIDAWRAAGFPTESGA